MTLPTYRKKLIEVALPLEAINRESAREKSIRHGHPSTLHLWWARRPLAACRAVLFASLVDDPSSRPEVFPTEEEQDRERQRLFRLIEELVKWENSTNEAVLSAARAEIMRSTDGNPPAVFDPFCGGGSIPLEAQRLGLEAHGSDLNPVPVLITKALIEIPPKFAGRAPVNPDGRRLIGRSSKWKGASGLAEDIRFYGRWMRDEAERRIGHHYPSVRLRAAQGGGEAIVIAWLWARTVTCPNPACGTRMPLIRSFVLASKVGKEAWVEAVVDRAQQPPAIRFVVHQGRGQTPEGTVNRRGATCVACRASVDFEHLRAEGRAGRMGAELMAVVAEGHRQRVYLSPDVDQERFASSAEPMWAPDSELPEKAISFRVQAYGMTRHRDLFTPRQLLAMSTFCDLVGEARERVRIDALEAAQLQGSKSSTTNAEGATAYADAVATYLGLGVGRCADFWCTIATWSAQPKNELVAHAFTKQALPMTWDFAEINPFSESGGNAEGNIAFVAKAVEGLPARASGHVSQQDAASIAHELPVLISTDPPYYDNIGYADLSDFFYVWHRRALAETYPSLFRTLLTPKAEELIATPYRFDGDRSAAQRFFETGLERAFSRMREAQDPRFPLTVFYAFKQSENSDDGAPETDGGAIASNASTGWETMLEGLIRAGFLIDGTWPVRTERGARSVGIGTNALASSIVLVCRPRSGDVPSVTRRQFLSELQRELPTALRNLQHGSIAPVDLAQAAIGPGMAIFSRHSRVLESDGSDMRVRTALALINQMLAETLTEQEGEMDADTRWALTWFDQHGFAEGPFGDANTLANAKNTSTDGLVTAGIVASARGKVRLLARDELAADWDPATDNRRTVWECAHYLIRELEGQGESGAARLLAKLGDDGERARDLAYRLYATCERRGWATEAQAYNSLAAAWSELTRLVSELPPPAASTSAQGALHI